jgi:hypothetical protein
MVKVLVQGLRNIRNDDYQRGTEDYAMVISETFEYRREGPEEKSDWHRQAYCWCITKAIVAKWKRKEGENIYIVQKNAFFCWGMSNFKNDIRLLLGLGAKDNLVSRINYYLIPAQNSIEFAPHES